MKTRIFILYTGGTIGMAPNDPRDPLSPLTPKPLAELLTYVPGFDVDAVADEKRFNSDEAKNLARKNKQRDKDERTAFMEMENGNVIEFGYDSFEKPMDSSDLTPGYWKRMATMIAAVYDAYDAFMILHGTDTMAYTSSALSFMFENLGKPVVITGSQRPIAAEPSDAVMNFVHAIHVAGYQAAGLPLIPEVVIVFADRILRGCRASKTRTKHWAGFDSPNFPWLGRIEEHIVIDAEHVLPPPAPDKTFHVQTDLDERVFNLSIFPGFSGSQTAKILVDEKTQGVLIRSYGTGNAPSDPAFLDGIQRAVDAGRLIVNISQCVQGMVEMGLYETGLGLLERGVLPGFDMTVEAALTKLMWTLGTRSGQEDRVKQMQIAQRGEQTENLFDLQFGSLDEEEAKDIYVNPVLPDERLDRGRISRAVLRISDLGCPQAETGDHIRVKAFMNMPNADHQTPLMEERQIASMEFRYDAEEPVRTRMHNVTHKTQNIIGNGDVSLTLIAERKPIDQDDYESASIFFRSLLIAIYAKV